MIDFSGSNWGITPGDIWGNVVSIAGSLAPFILLGIVVYYVPTIFELIRSAIFYKATTGRSFSAGNWVEEFRATHYSRKMRRRGH